MAQSSGSFNLNSPTVVGVSTLASLIDNAQSIHDAVIFLHVSPDGALNCYGNKWDLVEENLSLNSKHSVIGISLLSLLLLLQFIWASSEP